MPTLPISFGAGNLPEGWQGTPQQFLQMVAELLFGELQAELLTGLVDGTPSPDSGLWIHKVEGESTEAYSAEWYNEQFGQFLPLYFLPVGTVIMYAANDNPPWFIDCDGAEYQVAVYPILYSKIGIIHGGVEGVKFNVPDLRGRGPIGVGVGVDYLSDNKALIERTMGKDAGGYVGHDFIHKVTKPANGPTKPANQNIVLTPPGAGGIVTSGQGPATTLRFLIKTR